MLRILAGQVAIAIANSRLFEQSQKALEEVQSLHQQYVQQEWARVAAGQQGLGYEYRRSGTPTQWEPWPSELDDALIRGEPVVHYQPPEPAADGESDAGASSGSDGNSSQYEASLATPIKYRDQV
ncbi:MAG: hypothetical protein GWN58_29015, partial [Anaerolineae bacterium]|nr:hypothetical protein [Anaerolineae bacterium]